MLQKVKEKVFHRLYFRVFMYFICVVFVFAILIGSIFMRLYKAGTMSSYSNLLGNQATVIADRVNRYVVSSDIESYSVYMEMLEDSISADVWIFSNPDAVHPMSESLVNIQLTQEEISKDTTFVMQKAFAGDVAVKSGYSAIHDMKVVTVGAPIYDGEEAIVGAVLVIAPVETQRETTNSILLMFGISIMSALLVALWLSIIFTRRLTGPITKINKAARRLSEGKYDVNLQMSEQNEIGELAKTVDVLSTKLKENEIQREYMEQMRKDFFSNISHELRTPITVIRAYLESLVDGVVNEQKVSSYYTRMLAECEGIQRLIQDLLLLSKVENPDFNVEQEPVNVIQVFDDIVRSVRVVCAKKNIKLKIESDKEYCFINGDYDRIRQVFIAVLDNAIKFSDVDSTIYIKIDSLDKIRIQIKDTGIGMDQEELSHIFDKFYTKKMPNNKNGSGLGLVIAEKIVEKHGGTIFVESEKNRGTTFSFVFDQLFMEEEFEL